VTAQPTGPFSPRLRQGSLSPPPLGAGGSPEKSDRPTVGAGEEATEKHAREVGDPIWGFGWREAQWCELAAAEGRALVRGRRGARR
jgi:hypothetical protein